VVPVSLEEIASTYKNGRHLAGDRGSLHMIRASIRSAVGASRPAARPAVGRLTDIRRRRVVRALIDKHLERHPAQSAAAHPEETHFDLEQIKKASRIYAVSIRRPGAQFERQTTRYFVPDIEIIRRKTATTTSICSTTGCPTSSSAPLPGDVFKYRHADATTLDFLKGSPDALLLKGPSNSGATH